MILITYLSINDLKNYRKEFIDCLIHNSEIPTIKEIFIFTEASFENLPTKNKIKYFVKRNYTEVDIINYSKKLSSEKRIIWSKPFIKFNTDLIKLKTSESVFEKKNEYIIFNRHDIVNNGLSSLISEKTSSISTANLSKKNNNTRKSEIVTPKKIVSKIQKRVSRVNNVVKKEVPNLVNNKSKIDVILVSVDYNQYLNKILHHNTKIFKNITVVTHPDDIECIQICNFHKVNYIVLDEIYQNDTINKSIGLNKAIKSLVNPDWILIIDADIILNKEINLEKLNKEYLYTSGRYICDDMINYEKWKSGELSISRIGKLEADRGIGFFQLFNYMKKKSYPDSNYGRYSESTWSDIIFKQGFKKRKTLELDVIHLGKPYQKWKDIKFDKMFETEVKIIKPQEVIESNEVNNTTIELDIDINLLSISKRDENIEPKLAVITSFFNPMNYTNLKYNYLKFSEKVKQKADLFPIELSFNGDFFIEDDNVIRIDGDDKNILWQKEKLLNIALNNLPKEYTNVAWIDCDVLFENENWVNEINEKLKYYKVLQLYEKAKRLDEKGNINRLSEGAIKRISRINFVENALFGIPGFAWAMRRESIEKIGFLETQIIGGADALMYYSFFGVKDSVIHDKMNKEWKNVYLKWFDKMFSEINNSVNYITGDIIHLYHGKMKNRNYDHRYKILSEHNFDPEKDLSKSKNGLWEFKNKEISEKMSKYFESRNEDDNVISINDYFDNVYVLNLDRRPDRIENIKSKLDLLNIKFERFSAIDGNNITDNEYDFTGFIQGKGMLENKYALACLRSHIEIIKDAKFKGYNRILIFEDDVLISKDINIHLQKLRNIKDWKLLYLGSSQYNWNVEFIEDFFLSKQSLGTFAYAIDSSMYDEILNQSVEKSIDNVLSDMQNKYYGECYTFYPNICVSDVSESDIRSDRDQESHSKRMRWNLLKNYI